MSQKKRNKKTKSKDPHHSREQAKYGQPIASREFIISVLKAEKGPMGLEALGEKLELNADEQQLEALRRRVGAMLRDGQLVQNRKRGLVPVDTEALVAGRISAHPDGYGFVSTDDDESDIYLSGKQMRQVLHGDRVVLSIVGKDHRGRREGRIVEVVERANQSVLGRLSIDRGTVVVHPDNKRIHQNILIAPGELGEAKDGDMVVVEIVEQPSRRYQPVGRVAEVLGQHLEPGMEIDVALHSHGIPVEWPEAVLDQAAAFSPTVDESAATGRKDVRSLPLITIDGSDARDFDDAVWCERDEKGWRLLVAIADVAHYVSPESPLDEEAQQRGTSVYFPGRVVPMLPEVLSNGLCSLNPDVDRLCMLCEMKLDDKGSVKKTRFYNGIMRSHARLTYDQVYEMLTEKSSALRDQHASLLPMINELYALYKQLAKRRKKRGAIEFESNETHIIFDDNKKIKEIIPIYRNDAHKLIEECMILANIQAAAYLEEREVSALYRVHAGPKTDRLEDLKAFLQLRGLALGGGDSPTALDYAALADAISERSDRAVIQTVMLRSMQQAVYQPKNEGHFGLALEQYAHFTSPIRRYPDLLVHRAIKYALTKGKPKSYQYSNEAMLAFGESCSMTERRAEDASRDVVAWLKCEYMQDQVGNEFPGVVTAVTSFGLFVELDGIHVEGLVHITNLSKDYYRFDQAAQTLTGERTGMLFELGDVITVQVASVNLEDRKIDFVAVEQKIKTRASAKRKVKNDSAANKLPLVEEQSKPSAKKKPAKGSAEKRRQDKRRKKQERRDEKRRAMKEAKRLESIRAESSIGSDSDSSGASSESVVSKGKSADAKSHKRLGKKSSKKSAKKTSSRSQQKSTEKIGQGSSKKVSKKTSQAASKKSTKKVAHVSAKKTAKKVSQRVVKKPTGKLDSAATKKVAKKGAQSQNKKVAKKSTVIKKKITKKAAAGATKKTLSKKSRSSNKKVAKKSSQKVAKRTAKKTGASTRKKVAKKVAKKVSKKTTKKRVKKKARSRG